MTIKRVGIRAPSDLWGERRDILSLKSYSMLECVSVVIGMQVHSKCEENKNVNKYNYIESLHTQ